VHTDTLPPVIGHRQGHRTVIPGPLDPILTPVGRSGPRNPRTGTPNSRTGTQDFRAGLPRGGCQ